MSTRIINDIKYLRLCNGSNLKTLSLEDNVYFTLRDIFVNISDINYCMKANEFNGKLTDNIYYEDRRFGFMYTNILSNKEYVSRLNQWLMRITPCEFHFEPDDENDDNEEENLIKFDDWWIQFEELRKLIKNKLLTL